MALEDCLRKCLAERESLPPRPPLAHLITLLVRLARDTVLREQAFVAWMEGAGLRPTDSADILLAIAIANWNRRDASSASSLLER